MTIKVEHFGVNDFILRMKPCFNQQGDWDGYIDMEIITDNENTMKKSDYIQLMQ